MRPGPATARLRGALAVGVRVDVHRAGRVLAVDVPVTDAKLEWAGDRTVPGLLTYTAPTSWEPVLPLDALHHYGQRSVVHVVYELPDGTREETPLGEYVHTAFKSDSGGVTVSAQDLMRLPDGDPMAWPSSPLEGATLRGEMQRLAGSLPVALDAGVADAVVPRTSQWGTSRTEAMASLAAAHGCGLRVGADGVLHVYRLRDASCPDLLVRRDDGSLVDLVRERRDLERRPNRWVATAVIDGVQVTRTSEETGAPLDPAGYGWQTRLREVSGAKTAGDVEAALAEMRREDLVSMTTASIDVVPDARVEAGDVIGVLDADGVVLAGRVRSYSLPLSDVGASMRIDLDLLEW